MTDLELEGKPARIRGEVDLGVVRVTIREGDPVADAVHLMDGCTGRIRAILVEQWTGDGIKVGAGAHDLVVDYVHVRCYAKPEGKHQDGIQVLGGQRISFMSGYVGAFSVNNSQILIHSGARGKDIPTDVIFRDFVIDPQGAGSYGVSNGESVRSGFTGLRMLSRSNNHDLYQGKGEPGVTDPVWGFDYLPDGVRANFPLDL